jgi:hypothetical protein
MLRLILVSNKQINVLTRSSFGGSFEIEVRAMTKITHSIVLQHRRLFSVTSTVSDNVGFMVDEVTLGQVFFDCFGFPYHYNFTRSPTLIYHPKLVQWAHQ